jgi:hypothetical protein
MSTFADIPTTEPIREFSDSLSERELRNPFSEHLLGS